MGGGIYSKIELLNLATENEARERICTKSAINFTSEGENQMRLAYIRRNSLCTTRWQVEMVYFI
jgi:hypothetical protein